MNNIQKNNYLDLPICDTHLHLTYPEPLAVTTEIFRGVIDHFRYDSITLCCLSHSTRTPSDPVNNLKALYVKSVLNAEYGCDKVFVYGSPFHYRDARDTPEGYTAQMQSLYDMGADGYKMLEGK